MALLCTQHTHANPHTQTHTYRLTHARYGYVQSLERWWLRRRLLLLLLCVCFICIFNIYILYILSYWFKLFQRANTAFFACDFLISILLLFLCPAKSPACVPPNESLNWNWNWATQRAARSQDKDIFLLNEWVNEKACILCVCVCLSVCANSFLLTVTLLCAQAQIWGESALETIVNTRIALPPGRQRNVAYRNSATLKHATFCDYLFTWTHTAVCLAF